MIPESLKDLYQQGVHGGDNPSLLLLADGLEELGHYALANVFRRGAGYRQRYGTDLPPNERLGIGPFRESQHETELDTSVLKYTNSPRAKKLGWILFGKSLRVPLKPEEWSELSKKYKHKNAAISPSTAAKVRTYDAGPHLMNLSRPEPEQYRLHHVNKKTGEKIPFKDSDTLKLPKEKLEALAQKINGNQERPYPPDWEAQVLKLAQPGQSSVIVRVPLPQPVAQQPKQPATTRIQKSYVW